MTTRRQFLAATAGVTTAGAVADAGSGSVLQDVLDTGPNGAGAWDMYANDAANTGFNQETSGPQSDVGPAWEFTTDGQISSAPAVVDGTVYTGSRDGRIYALDADSGSEQWRFDTGSDVRSSPAVVDGTLYVGTQAGTVYAVDAEEGEQQWRFGTEEPVRSSPTVVEETVYVGSQDSAVYAIDASDGTERWRFETGFWVESSPAVDGGTLYVGSDDGNLYALDAADGEQLWTFATADRVPGSPAVVEETVYVGSQDGNVYALDTEGEERWRFDTGGAITSSPAVADGVVYVGSRSHSVFALESETGEQQWAFDTGRQITSSPAVADGVVYVGSESHEVYGIDGDGDELWRFDTGRPVSAAPAVVDAAVYVGSENRTLYALEEGFETASSDAPDDQTTDGQRADDGTDTDQTADDPGLTLPSGRAFLLPATAVGFAVAVVGGYYVLNRTGMLDPIETASDVYGDESDENEEDDTDRDTPAVMNSSQLWELVVGDVIGRAKESEVTATQDMVVTKYLDRDTLESPVVAYRIQSVRSEPASVRLTESLVESGDQSRPLGDGWRVEDRTAVYETVVEPGETVTTLLGRRDCPPERADELLEKPVVEVDGER